LQDDALMMKMVVAAWLRALVLSMTIQNDDGSDGERRTGGKTTTPTTMMMTTMVQDTQDPNMQPLPEENEKNTHRRREVLIQVLCERTSFH
jgi:hypothetical protein